MRLVPFVHVLSLIRFGLGAINVVSLLALLGCQPIPIAISPTPSPNATALPFPLSQLQKDWGFVTTIDECQKIIPKGTCLLYYAEVALQRQPWQELFPKATFWLIKMTELWEGYGKIPDGGGSRASPRIVAEQNGQIYTPSDFDHLLQANGIISADDQRGRIAEAFALMTLPYYIENEILFTDSSSGDFRIPLEYRQFNYRLVTFTRLNGLRAEYYFIFDSKGLAAVKIYSMPDHSGGLAYTPVPFPVSNTLPLTPTDQLFDFRK